MANFYEDVQKNGKKVQTAGTRDMDRINELLGYSKPENNAYQSVADLNGETNKQGVKTLTDSQRDRAAQKATELYLQQSEALTQTKPQGEAPEEPGDKEPGGVTYNPNGTVTDKNGTVWTLKGWNARNAGAKTTEVSYIDEDGQKQTGVTETPEEAAAEPSREDRLRGYYNDSYDNQVAANNAAAEAAIARARETTDQQLAALSEQYAGADKELYRNYMNQQRLLPQQLAAQGYSGGMSESARIRMGNAYQEALNGNQQALANDRTALNAAYTNAQYEAQAAADAANAQALQQRDAYLAALEENLYSQEETRNAQRAQNLAALGDFTGYLALGYSQTDVDAMARMWIAANPGMRDAWIDAHPEDAARLGIRKTAQRSYTPADVPTEDTGAPTKDEYAVAYQLAKASGDTKGAANVYQEYLNSEANDGGSLNPHTGKDYEYWARVAG